MAYSISLTKRTNGGFTIVTENGTYYPSTVIYHGTAVGVALYSRGVTTNLYKPTEWTINGVSGFTTVVQVCDALDSADVPSSGGNTSAIVTLLENAPVQTTGSVALATSRLIPTAAGVKMNRQKISIQLLSTNLSAPTTFAPEGSVDGTNWDVLTENETDITHTLVDDAPFFRTYENDKDTYIRWALAGVTTGDVAYKINN